METSPLHPRHSGHLVPITIVIIVGLGVFVATVLLLRRPAIIANTDVPLQERSVLIAAARQQLDAERAKGKPLEQGPCLGRIADDWVADVAHQPRQAVDDDPANQCEAFRVGTVRHFVELTPSGELIRLE